LEKRRILFDLINRRGKGTFKIHQQQRKAKENIKKKGLHGLYRNTPRLKKLKKELLKAPPGKKPDQGIGGGIKRKSLMQKYGG